MEGNGMYNLGDNFTLSTADLKVPEDEAILKEDLIFF
jgi:hypothetical protein